MNKKLLSPIACLLLVEGTWAAVPNIQGQSWEIEAGGNNTTNAGCATNVALAGMATDGAATAANTTAPVFTSASYNFVMGDAGHWLFIAAGTNWTPGWYKISSVAANAATLDGVIGNGQLTSNQISTAAGVATVASPTGATWAIDYTRTTTGPFTGADLNANTATTIHNTSSHTYTVADVGNCIVVSGGTSCTAGTFQITAVAAGVATIDRSIGASCVNATYHEGGAFNTLDSTNSLGIITGNTVWAKGNYSVSGQMNVGGAGSVGFFGYGTVRGDGVRSTVTLTAVLGTSPVIQLQNAEMSLKNITVNCNGNTGHGFRTGSNAQTLANATVSGCSDIGIDLTNGVSHNIFNVLVTGMVNVGAATNLGIDMVNDLSTVCTFCVVVSGATSGISTGGNIINGCIVGNNTGAASDGLVIGTASHGGQTIAINGCSVYTNGRDGLRISAAALTTQLSLTNTIFWGNAGKAINNSAGAAPQPPILFANNAYVSGGLSGTGVFASPTDITLTADPFVAGGSNNFALNKTTGGGKAVIGKGFPGVLSTGGTGISDIGALQSGSGGAGGTISYAFSQ